MMSSHRRSKQQWSWLVTTVLAHHLNVNVYDKISKSLAIEYIIPAYVPRLGTGKMSTGQASAGILDAIITS